MTKLQLARLKTIADQIALLAEELELKDLMTIGADKDYISVRCDGITFSKFSFQDKYTVKGVAKDENEGYQE